MSIAPPVRIRLKRAKSKSVGIMRKVLLMFTTIMLLLTSILIVLSVLMIRSTSHETVLEMALNKLRGDINTATAYLQLAEQEVDAIMVQFVDYEAHDTLVERARELGLPLPAGGLRPPRSQCALHRLG